MKAMDWVDFAEVKSAVSLKMVLDHYGIRLRPSGPDRLRGKCPLPSHSSKDSSESFIATLNKGKGGAWSCHSSSCAAARGGKIGGNALDFVAAMEKCSVRDAAIKLQTIFLVPAAGNSPSDAKAKPSDESHASVVLEAEEKSVSEKDDGGGESGPNKPLGWPLKNLDYTHPYLVERGITEETARKFDVGYFSGKGSMHGRISIAIDNKNGERVAHAGRSIDGTEPRYRFPPGFRKSLELFNVHRVKGEMCVVIVEGFFDCMKIQAAGFPCVALMGCAMTEPQEDLIADHFGSVVLMLDGDEAGRNATETIRDRLARRVFSVRTVELDDGVQPDLMTQQEILAELKTLFQ